MSVHYLPTRLGAHIEVHDCGTIGPNPPRPHLRAAAPDSEHGRGLGIIAALAHEWGPLPRPASGLWFTVARIPATG